MQQIQETELQVQVSESEIGIVYDGQTSIVPIDDDGFYIKEDAHIANGHPVEIVDIAIGFMEVNQALYEGNL